MNWGASAEKVDYERVYRGRKAVFATLYKNFIKNIPTEFYEFCESQDYWLSDFSLFMAEKEARFGMPWQFWSENVKKESLLPLKRKRKNSKRKCSIIKCCSTFFISSGII